MIDKFLIEKLPKKDVFKIERRYESEFLIYVSELEKNDVDLQEKLKSMTGIYFLLSGKEIILGDIVNLEHSNINYFNFDRMILITRKTMHFSENEINYLLSKLSEKYQIELTKKIDSPKDLKDEQLVEYLLDVQKILKFLGVELYISTYRKFEFPIILTKKGEVKDYLIEKSVYLPKMWNYASLQHKKAQFWVNPKVSVLEEDWYLILNDQKNCEIIILNIPANSLNVETSDMIGLKIRKDKPYYLDLQIDQKTMIENKSGIGFAEYEKERIKY